MLNYNLTPCSLRLLVAERLAERLVVQLVFRLFVERFVVELVFRLVVELVAEQLVHRLVSFYLVQLHPVFFSLPPLLPFALSHTFLYFPFSHQQLSVK